jgi:hypothetical protein
MYHLATLVSFQIGLVTSSDVDDFLSQFYVEPLRIKPEAAAVAVNSPFVRWRSNLRLFDVFISKNRLFIADKADVYFEGQSYETRCLNKFAQVQPRRHGGTMSGRGIKNDDTIKSHISDSGFCCDAIS